MSLELYFHPFASFCQKVLVALYENDTPFEPHFIDLGDERSSAELKRIWPIGRFPVLRDNATARTIPESTLIIEYLARHHPGKTQLVPGDPDLAWETRLRDRFFDLYVDVPMQKIVTDRIRPAGKNDPHGVEEARALLRIAYDWIDREMETRTWANGDGFSMADCAATRPVLREPGDALRRHAQGHGGVPRPPDGASVLRARGRGSDAVPRELPEVRAGWPGSARRSPARPCPLSGPW